MLTRSILWHRALRVQTSATSKDSRELVSLAELIQATPEGYRYHEGPAPNELKRSPEARPALAESGLPKAKAKGSPLVKHASHLQPASAEARGRGSTRRDTIPPSETTSMSESFLLKSGNVEHPTEAAASEQGLHCISDDVQPKTAPGGAVRKERIFSSPLKNPTEVDDAGPNRRHDEVVCVSIPVEDLHSAYGDDLEALCEGLDNSITIRSSLG